MTARPTQRIRADFNGLFGKYLCLSHGDTGVDDSGRQVVLQAGMHVTAFDDDVGGQGRPDQLIASGIVEPSGKGYVGHGSKWMLHIDEYGVRHQSDLTSGE
jgi:hypothetical protein